MRFEKFGGTPEEIGRGKGRAYGGLLREQYGSFCTYTGEERDRAVAVVEDMRLAVEEAFPDLALEMEAIAEASGMGYDELTLLTYCEELGRPKGCSQAAVVRTEVGPVYMKSEDIGPGAFDNVYAVSELSPEGGHRFLQVAPVNWTINASSGVNEAGLCMGESSVGYTDSPGGGVPRLTLMRAALQYCSSVKEAVELYAGHSTAIIGGNCMMVDASGDAAVVEKSPRRQGVREPERNGMWCTNHPTLDAMKEIWDVGELREGREENSRARWAKLEEFVRGYDALDAVEAFEGMLRTHGEGGICQHTVLWTIFSLVMVPARREMRVTDGPPCRSEFTAYRLG